MAVLKCMMTNIYGRDHTLTLMSWYAIFTKYNSEVNLNNYFSAFYNFPRQHMKDLQHWNIKVFVYPKPTWILLIW